MFRDDQSSRLVTEMMSVISQLAALKRERNFKDAIDTINYTTQSFLGLSPRFVKGISEQDLVNMVRSGLITPERIMALAKLIKERADINWAEGQPDNGLIRTVKALTLYLEVFSSQAETPFPEFFDDIEGLAANLGEYRLPDSAMLNLFHYYEAAGKYSKAEDLLFEVLEQSSGTGWIEEGRRFYDRLSKKTDSELDGGGLPREELAEGLAELAQFEPGG